VRAVVAGEVTLSPSVARQMAAPADADAAALTERELTVLALAAQGRTSKAIGHALHISETTVKTHLKHIYAKLDVPDRAAAVALALRRGLLPPDDSSPG